LVVKTPVYFRKRPPGLFSAQEYLGSTWILARGKWEKVEDRASPLEQQDRFDRWVERAHFQYHPVGNLTTPAPRANVQHSPAQSHRDNPASRVSPGQSLRDHPASQATDGSVKNTQAAGAAASSKHPRLTISTDGLYLRETPGEHPVTVHAAHPYTAPVINTLLRVVHGGSVGWGGLPHVYRYQNDLYPAENQDPDRNLTVIPGTVFKDRPVKTRSRRDKRLLWKRKE
jgi:hypothetical protein